MPLVYVNSDGSRVYDVEKGVGVNCPNQRMDVKLVQYMLGEIYAAGFGAPPTPTPLQADAWIGPTTIAWIRQFQKDVNSKWHDGSTGPKCVVDGRVDAITSYKAKGTVSKLTLTIAWLNCILKQRNPRSFDNVTNVVSCFPATIATRPNPYNPKPQVHRHWWMDSKGHFHFDTNKPMIPESGGF